MNALLKIFSIGMAVTLLSHCSDEPDVNFADFAPDETKHFAMGRVDLTSVCDSASVTLDDGSVLQGQMNCASMKLQPCTEELQTGCIVPKADDLNSAPTVMLVSVDSLVAANIKTGVIIGNVEGTLDPDAGYEFCTGDGQVDCVATAAYKSAEVANITAGDLKNGKIIAGIGGTLPDCSVDGGVGCVANASYKAADMSQVTQGNIKNGVKVAGVTGNLGIYADCTADGGVGCITTNSFKAAHIGSFSGAQIKSGTTIAGVPGTLPDCNIDGGTECVAVDGFKAADMGQFAATDIKFGKTIAGRNGSVANCTGDLAVGCITTGTYKSFNPTAGVNASKVRSGTTIAGVDGTLPDCSTDGQSSACVIAGVYKAVDETNLLKGNIKKGVSLGGLTGDYPSTNNPLPDANLTPLALNTTNLNTRLANSATFEFWDSAGVRHTGNGSDDLDAGNIKLGVTLFGVPGSMVAAAGGAPDAWDIRKGTTINGVTGEIDTSCGTTVCNGSAFEDVSTESDGTTLSPCDSSYTPGSNHCMYKDRITNLTWTDDQGRMQWDAAKSACEALSYGGQTDWRLPTVTELLQMMNHGMRAFNGHWQGSSKSVWTENDTLTAADSKTVIPFAAGQPLIDHGIYDSADPSSNANRETICVLSP